MNWLIDNHKDTRNSILSSKFIPIPSASMYQRLWNPEFLRFFKKFQGWCVVVLGGPNKKKIAFCHKGLCYKHATAGKILTSYQINLIKNSSHSLSQTVDNKQVRQLWNIQKNKKIYNLRSASVYYHVLTYKTPLNGFKNDTAKMKRSNVKALTHSRNGNLKAFFYIQ